MEKIEKNIRPYMSCIKVNGTPILPPIITPARRVELLRDKQRAVQIENSLKKKRDDVISKSDVPVVDDVWANKEFSYVSYECLERRTRHLSLDVDDISDCQDHSIECFDKDVTLSGISQVTTQAESLPDDSIQPRLIRSNSYVIEKPSPCLLAHLEQTSNRTTSEATTVQSIEKDCSPDSFYGTPQSDMSIENTLLERSCPIEVVQTDVIVQQITVHADPNNPIFDENPVTAITKPDTVVADSETQLLNVLKDIPEEYSKQIIDLIHQQKSEQQKRLMNYENLMKQLFDSNTPSNGIVSVPVNNVSSVSSTQLILPENEKEKSPNLITVSSRGSVDLTPQLIEDRAVQKAAENSASKVNRQLFPNIDVIKENKRREDWAASVIGAYARGYLTRRLLKTDKVRGLIETIKETLVCALQLHGNESLDEYDIELHRRLIQQVSAACFAFHDVFFALSVQEQMMLIAADRQYKREKALRPQSARSVSSRSSSVGRSPRLPRSAKV